jgi:monooxygenase
VEKHFTPTYNPWDQRLCLVPNSDLFVAIKEGKASVATDSIERFDTTGIVLTSGEHLDADIIVTATGLELVTLGEMDFVVDGEPVDFAKTWTYKGMAYSGVPNLVSSFGYVNASWTLRSDLTCQYVCRLLNHMSETGTTRCTPTLRDADKGMPERPWIDEFTPNYMKRVMHLFPRQGDREPWVNPQNYRIVRSLPTLSASSRVSPPRVRFVVTRRTPYRTTCSATSCSRPLAHRAGRTASPFGSSSSPTPIVPSR